MLTPEQIQKIDWFFEDKGMEFYDLRTELVDHVSEAIENQMSAHYHISFEQAFKEETRKFTRKDLALQLAEAHEKYSPLKEWRYFTLKRIGILLLIFLLLVLPVILVNKELLIYMEILYLLIGTGWYLSYLLQFKRKYKNPRKKVSVYSPERLSGYLFPIIIPGFLFLNILRQHTIPPVDQTIIFIVFIFWNYK
ncbi:hypothetical protein [Niabella hibiscisoli]|uniref:hypothetical protein n=1 Tax=Niabella hibiscisoli TaxID=1825928 RepID=UPI001F0D5E32|nr:hypothetical protein [Niabella hibiscisoli]MCH5716044.1 hypothetical protein [Niabella hibiscisoli]